ncbi:hypothetical protein [Janthinobacterium sp.]|uniref:hypothetical protein n=1 Tax=Janthinobacterium sp. TaxID=1871054 RepID=UPI0025C4141D|nr:hypothetical protein [Janthinobacterium sp.]
MIDLLDLVRSIAAAAARAAENKHYPSPCSQGSPLLASVRQACVERGYTGDGLALLGVTADAAPADSFQSRVQPWMMACFGAEIAADGAERNHRFLEESLELVQACGCTASEAQQLVDYVYGRPIGERAQEVGGVMVTLAALCLAQGLDMHAAGEIELARIWTKVEAIRAKQAAKPKHSPLPAAVPQPIIGRLMDQMSALPVLRGLNEPGALLRNSDVFHVLVAAGREQAGIAAAPAPRPAAKDTCAEMRGLCSACGGTGDVHGLDGEWRGQCTCVHAWQQRAEKAEARVKEVEASKRQVLQAEGGHPAPCARDCEAPSFANQVRERDARIAQLEAQLVRRRAPLSPEMQQAIVAARAAGQTIAAAPGGLVFLNNGAEPGSGELDCPACGGSGHAGDLQAGSTS